MRIGELARRSGASARSLRYYEQQGLLQARRQPNGYREYDETELALVREIRSLLDSGFDLEEIRPFVECLRSGIQARQACPGAVDVYRQKLAELDGYVGRLQQLRDRVAGELVQLADGSPTRLRGISGSNCSSHRGFGGRARRSPFWEAIPAGE